MKKTVWILMLLMVALSLFACGKKTDQTPIDYNRAVREGVDVIASLEQWQKTQYNQAGNPLTRDSFDLHSMKKEATLRYRYDENGKLIELLWDDTSMILSYDEKGAVVSGIGKFDHTKEIVFTCTGDRIQAEERNDTENSLQFTYDTNGSVIQESYEKRDKKVTYVREGKKIQAEIFRDEYLSDQWTVVFNQAKNPVTINATYRKVEATYSYDKNGLCTTVSALYYDQLKHEAFNEYQDGMLKLQTLVEYDIQGKPKESEVHEYTYDENGQVNRIAFYTIDHRNQGFLKSDTQFDYNADGACIQETVSSYYLLDQALREKTITSYSFDADKNRIQKTVLHYTNNDYFDQKECWDYDTDGYLVRYTDSAYRSEDSNPTNQTVYYYDNGGVLYQKDVTRYYAGGKTASLCVEYYDANQVCVQMQLLNYLENGDLDKKLLREYNAQGRVLKEQNWVYDSKGEVSSETLKEYYDGGKLKQEMKSFFDGSIVIQKELVEYHENQNKKRTLEAYYYETGELRTQTVVEYNLDGNKTKVVVTNGKKGEKAFVSSVDELRYDDEGNCIESIDSQYYHNGWLRIQSTTKYDKNGYVIEEIDCEFSNNKPIQTIVETYERYDDGATMSFQQYVYGEENRLLKKRYTRYLQEGGGLSDEIYEYDSNGDVSKWRIQYFDEEGRFDCYEVGEVSMTKQHSATGLFEEKIRKTQTRTYDKEDKLLSSKTKNEKEIYNLDGLLLRKEIKIYDGENMYAKLIFMQLDDYDKEGTVVKHELYEYDLDGKVIREEAYDNSNA